ncbi:MAG TPA: hypothetical protein VFN37_14140 [Candidatus Baltobacteraceae bacterium]|nr:hypothetical protein [Candidatus Baltobacteraceae bacterium]
MVVRSVDETPPTPEQMQRMGALIAELKRSGVLIDTGGAMEGALELCCSRKNGKYSVTGGPFAEVKEVVGGDVAGDGTCEQHEVASA